MTVGRAAVDVGTSMVRVATARDGVDHVAEVVADPAVPLSELLAGLLDGADVVVLVDGEPPAGGGPRPSVPSGTVSGAAAVAGRREMVVLDVGHRSSRACLIRGGTVVARRTAPGGHRLDEAVASLLRERCPSWAGRDELRAEARRIREALSLQPTATARLPGSGQRVQVDVATVWTALREPLGEIVDAVGRLAAPAVPVHVVGGGARSPQLAELLDRAGRTDVSVAARPDTALVLAALHAPAPPPPPAPPPVARPSWLGDPRPDGSRALRWVLGAAAVVLGLGALHLLGGTLTPPAAPSGVLAQYDYRFAVPTGWEHTGGLPERRRSLLTPVGAPEGSDLIAVESTALGYDSAAEPQRAAAELRAEFEAAAFEAAAAGDALLSGYDPAAHVAGRAVTAYRERDGATAVRWYVVLDGGAQLSVGCRYTPAGAVAVEAACAAVVASVRSGR